MTDRTITEKGEFSSWAHHAKEGRIAIYYRTNQSRVKAADLFAYARKLFDDGKVILFQRRTEDGQWEYCAQRCSCRASAWLDRLSASIYVKPSRAAYRLEPFG